MKFLLIVGALFLSGCSTVGHLSTATWPKPEVAFYHADTRAHALSVVNEWQRDPKRYVTHLDARTHSMRPMLTGGANEWLLLDRYIVGQPVHAGLVVSFNRDAGTPRCLHLIASVSADGRWMYVTGINNRVSDGWHETATISGILRQVVDLPVGR